MSTSELIRVLELRSVRGKGGGPEKTILHGAARSDSARFHVVVCYIRDERDQAFDLGERARELGVDYVEVMERHSMDRRILPRLTRLVAERHVDLVHSHDHKTDALALWLARTTGVVPLATAHGWTGQSAKERYLYYPADKWLLGRFPRVVAVSTDIRNEIVRRSRHPAGVTVILNGIDPDAFRRHPDKVAAARASLGIASDEVVVGAVGRIERQKRFDLLLVAMAPIFASHPKTRLVIVGDGSLLPRLRSQAEEQRLSGRVIFAGHRGDIAAMHHAFDLFVQSSEYEGTPNAVLEAMAMETPLVATAAGGTAELVIDGTHGIIVPVRDVPALTGAIEQSLNEPQTMRRRADAARRRVEVELSFDSRTRRLETIYAEMVNA